MYKGASLLTVDDKGRIAIPGRFRESLLEECQGHVVVTMYYNKSLVIYPNPVWLKLEQRLRELPSGNVANRALKEMTLGHADDRKMDGQGRILLAEALRTYAGLERDGNLIGQVNKLVLWAQQTNEQRYRDWDQVLNNPNLSDTLNELDL